MGGEQDHSGSLSGGDDVEPNKKRKVPESLVTAESDRTCDSTRHAANAAHRHRRQSAVHNAQLFHKALFLQRKAAFLTLFIDATHAVKAGAKAEHVVFPELAVLERLLLSLQYVGVGDWLPDKSSWRSGVDEPRPTVPRKGEKWRKTFEQRRRRQGAPLAPLGQAPEGNFEFEFHSNVSGVLRDTLKDRAALRKLTDELRDVVLAPRSSPPPAALTNADTTITAKQKLKKKKKRSVLANQGNPHHVGNYRQTRLLRDPHEPFPHHASLLFPPSMRFLAARPGRSQVRPSENDFLCWICEYHLYYGTERARKDAIRRRRRNLRGPRKVKSGAGKVDVSCAPHEALEDDCEDESHGRCSCGRPINTGPAIKDKEPPDKASAKT